METADWALAISLCSFVVSLAGFVWNVWSKFIYPKPKVRVTFSVNMMVDDSGPGPEFLSLSATNYGPGPVTLHSAIGRAKGSWLRKKHFIMNPLHNFPLQLDFTIGPFSGGLPKKIEPGESFSAYFVLKHEALRDEPVIDVGFSDTFGRSHWAARKQVKQVRKSVAEAFLKQEAPVG